MARKISKMTWEEVQQEMSIAGSPEKIAACCRQIMEDVRDTIDSKNPSEFANIELGLHRILAEIKVWKRIYEERTGQKISL